MDLWLLTEAREAVALAGHTVHLSVPRSVKPVQCWSAVASRWAMQGLPVEHEGLALARVTTPHGPVLVACSVMPWRGARASWPGDPAAPLSRRFADSLQAHLEHIQQARQPAEPVIWGGDFNQALTGPEHAGTLAGRARLVEAFAVLDLRAATVDVPHLLPHLRTIDHVAVPAAWQANDFRREVPRTEAGKPLSDHAAYVGRAQPPP